MFASIDPAATRALGVVRTGGGAAQSRGTGNNQGSINLLGEHGKSMQDSTEGHAKEAVAPMKRGRMKGIELADALLLPRLGGGGKGVPPPVPLRVESNSVPVLTSVFPHAQGDVGGLSKRLWSGGAADNVTVVVMTSVATGLRIMHAMGMPHGDLKPANILYSKGQFCLTDMPALNWTATPVLTKDPVAHTMVRGKRFLCNDMWGLGMVCLGLVCGHTKFEGIKTRLRGCEDDAALNCAYIH